MHNRSVAEAILEQLGVWGVKRIYGVVGDAIFGLMDAVAKQSAIRFISVKHESAAALMASAEAKCTGNLGVCAAQMGPGLANLLNGMADAYMDGAPVLAITGQAPLPKIGTAYKQFLNQQDLVQAVTDYSQLVVHPNAVMDSLSVAIHTAMAMDTVSHLSIPADVFTMPVQPRLYERIQISRGQAESEKLNEALQIMRTANRPMILAGNRARPAGTEILRLAEAWGSGVALSYGATGIIPDEFRLGLGGLGEGGSPYAAGKFKEADVVLAVETAWWPDGQTPEEARVIRIHHQSIELGTGMPVHCGLIGEPAAIVSQLVEELKSHVPDPAWVQQLEQCKQTWAAQNELEGQDSGVPLHPSRIVRAMEKCAAPDAVIALDEGDSTLWFMRNFRALRQQVLQSVRWRTMGFGLPAALAAKCCLPQQQVICLTGDGGLGMVLADLLTAARYQLNITLIVVNNGALQMETNKMEAKGLIPEGTEIANPDFVKLAEACGWDAYRPRAPEELERLIQSSLSGSKPVLLDVPTKRVPYPNYPNT